MKLGARRVVGGAGAAFVAALVLAFVAAVPAGSVPPAVDHPGFMHDVAHSSFSSDATTITPSGSLSLKWTFQEAKAKGRLRPAFYSTPIVVEHVMYVGSNSGEFYAIDMGTGGVIWQHFLGFEPKATCRNQGFYATAASGTDPTTGASAIYAASGDGNVYALRASDGAILWTSPVNVADPGTNDRFSYSSPTLANGKIYIGIASECDNAAAPVVIRGGVVALDQATGTDLATWYSVPSGQTGGSVWSTPAVGPDGSVFVTTGDATSALLSGDSQSMVRLDPNTLARLDGYQVVTGKDDSDFGGSPSMFTATLDGVSTSMVAACNKNGYYYAWKANALSDGPVWKYRVARRAHNTGDCDGGAVWDGSNVYVGGASSKIGGAFYRGSMSKLNPATGTVIWTTALPEAIRTYPSLDGAGALVAASFDTTSATNRAFLFNASTGSYRVVNDGNTLAVAAPVFADQYLVIANLAGTIYTYQTP
jgi:outer membrane protein assembly factor BamB